MQVIYKHSEGIEKAVLILWLRSESASFAIGATFVVDGGLMA